MHYPICNNILEHFFVVKQLFILFYSEVRRYNAYIRNQYVKLNLHTVVVFVLTLPNKLVYNVYRYLAKAHKPDFNQLFTLTLQGDNPKVITLFMNQEDKEIGKA